MGRLQNFFRLGRKRERKPDEDGKGKASKRFKLRRHGSFAATTMSSASQSVGGAGENLAQAADFSSVRLSSDSHVSPPHIPIESTYLFGSFSPRSRNDPFLSILEYGAPAHTTSQPALTSDAISHHNRIETMLDDVGRTLLSLPSGDTSRRSRAVLLLQFLELVVALDPYIPAHMLAPTAPIDRDWQALKTDSQVHSKLVRTLEVYHSERRARKPVGPADADDGCRRAHRRKLRRTQTLFRAYFGTSMPTDDRSSATGAALEATSSADLSQQPIVQTIGVEMDQPHDERQTDYQPHALPLLRPIPRVALPPDIRKIRKPATSRLKLARTSPWVPATASASASACVSMTPMDVVEQDTEVMVGQTMWL